MRFFLLSFGAALILFCTAPARAQDNPPVAQPVNIPAQPPVAQPVDPDTGAAPDTNTAPVARPVSPAPPIAQPVVTPPTAPKVVVPPTAPPASPSNTTLAPDLVVLNPAAARFDSAMSLFDAGQFANAVTAFSDFIRNFPRDRRREEALYRLAESYRNLGRAADALAAYTFELREFPDGPLRINAELKQGALLFDSGEVPKSISPLRDVAATADGEIKQAATYLLGRALLATQKEPEARPLLQAIADAQPPQRYSGEAAQALAELDDGQNRYADAVALWRKALELAKAPADKATFAARGGWSALQAGNLKDAEELFQTARKLDATGGARKVANTGLLRILFQQKLYGEWVALYEVEQNQLLEKGRAEILYDLGHAQFSLKHWSAAAEAFDQYLREFPDAADAVTIAYERFLAGAQIDRTKIVTEAEAFLKVWPTSPDRARVQLIEAQELASEGKLEEARPIWETLAQVKGDAAWPHRQILLELARSCDELRDWAKAATAYQAYLDDTGQTPGPKQLHVQARLAVCLQNSEQLTAATQAWQVVQSQAAAGSPDEQMALESLGLIYARGGPPDEAQMVSTFRALLEKYPQSPLRALAAFTVGDALFKNRDYAGAEKYLLEAREWDAKAWTQPATQRLALGAYGMKEADKALLYLKEYDPVWRALAPADREAARLPAAFYYWLAENARAKENWPLAESLYSSVTAHPAPGDLLAGAWWQLGQVQGGRKDWPAAVSSYGKYRQLKPDTKNATVVILALGRANLGAGNMDVARALAQQALLQEPEGPNSAAARMLLGETALAAHSNAEAARTFATLAVLFDDRKITPQAMARAADAFQAAGDAASAAQWRQKLQAKYPGFQPTSYL